MFGDLYKSRRVLVTGHTGFKGSWLALWLKALGAEVSGLALDPQTMPNHWDLLRLDMPDHRIDIRDRAAVEKAVAQAAPEIVFHLAAQPLVRRSYREPAETWATNVQGTVHVLEACRRAPDLRAVVVITTDKCYENDGTGRPYAEGDRLGGHDPYSASKAATELVVASYRDAFFRAGSPVLAATARAGNVIGGGDWSEDRLVPDLVRAVQAGQALAIRAPAATRPWQHVLEPLAGYLQLAQKLHAGDRAFEGGWNFGPDDDAVLSVEGLLRALQSCWPAARWEAGPAPEYHEAALLRLDSGKARARLPWRPVWPFATQVQMTAAWYDGFLRDRHVASAAQLESYIRAAQDARAPWC